ncbi:hypothetical protein [Taibaiella soli]|uniref:DUF3575 domain-containing protein n=1 Tax=Taibaiella soli TaxID=1649169 RepID=A0A2W2B718_9BACT|nr:hypothetical protein [Taibaiella soli]PZF71797.1 hypothetical protein DN068_17175 [Taibaiella soli]
MRSIALSIALSGLLLHSNAYSQENTTRNIISVSPAQVTNASLTGFGLQYERMLSKKFSLYIPVAYSFGKNDPCEPASRVQMGYVFPGIKFYPAGNAHTVSYSFGPSLGLGVGRLTNSGEFNWCPAGEPSDPPTLKRHSTEIQFGLLINNALNINISRHFYTGLEAGMGIMYFDKVDGKNYGQDIMIQGNLRFGYRF